VALLQLPAAPARGPAREPAARFGAFAAAALICAAVATQRVDYGVYDLRVRALDSNADGAILERLGDAALLAAAVAAAFLAAHPPRRATTVGLSLLLAFLAVDRLVGLHEEVSHWRVLYLPIVAATLLALAAVAGDLRPAGVRLLLGGILLLAFSFVLHELGAWLMVRLGAAPDGWAYQLKVGVKHGTEVAGWLLVALGIALGGRASTITRHSGTGTRR